MKEWWDQEYWGNPLSSYIVALVIVALGFIIAGRLADFLRKLANGREKNGRLLAAEGFRAFADSLRFLVFGITQVFALKLLLFPGTVELFQDVASDIILVLAICRTAWQMVRVPEAWVNHMVSSRSGSLNSMFGPMVRNSLRSVILILGLLQCIQLVSNQDLTTILAGLGFGAAALALASQQSISNFFGAIVIFINRPFEMGERIVYNGSDGTIEEVGIMCTKQRTLEGHLVTIPNGKLSGDMIRNVSKRPNIRQIHNITITYDTPPEKIERALEILKELLKDHPGMIPAMPPRVYFNGLNADSLNLFCIFWYHPADWWPFNDFNQRFLLETIKRFGAEGIDFAFPSQTVYLAGDENRPLEFAIRKASEKPDTPA